MNWMQRFKREFAIDIKTCNDCGVTLRVIARIEDPPPASPAVGLIQDLTLFDASHFPEGWTCHKIQGNLRELFSGFNETIN